jgi:hypothetical protein
MTHDIWQRVWCAWQQQQLYGYCCCSGVHRCDHVAQDGAGGVHKQQEQQQQRYEAGMAEFSCWGRVAGQQPQLTQQGLQGPEQSSRSLVADTTGSR